MQNCIWLGGHSSELRATLWFPFDLCAAEAYVTLMPLTAEEMHYAPKLIANEAKDPGRLTEPLLPTADAVVVDIMPQVSR